MIGQSQEEEEEEESPTSLTPTTSSTTRNLKDFQRAVSPFSSQSLNYMDENGSHIGLNIHSDLFVDYPLH